MKEFLVYLVLPQVFLCFLMNTTFRLSSFILQLMVTWDWRIPHLRECSLAWLDGRKWCLFDIWVWFYMILVELKGSKKSAIFIVSIWILWTTEFPSNEEMIPQIRDPSFPVYTRLLKTCFCLLSKFLFNFSWKDVDSTCHY